MLYANVIKTLGLQVRPCSSIDMINLTRRGLPRRSAETLRENLNISTRELAQMLSISVRTLQRVGEDEHFNALVSGRLMTIAKVFAHAVDVFESEQRAAEWLKTPCRALADNRPIELLDTPEGAELVLSEIEAIAYGTIA